MNKLIITAAALACAAQAFAFVEKTEQMTVVKADGSTVVFDVADLDQVTFDEVEVNYPFYIQPATGNVMKLTAVPTVFRMSPAETGDPYQFGISAVAAETPADARQGEYAVQIKVAPTVMNTSGVDLSDKSNVIVTLYRYVDGKVDNVWESQVSGTLTTALNSKTQAVTIDLEADFEDGTSAFVSYVGKVTNVDDLVGLNPPFEYINQGQYFNYDGTPYGLFDVTSCKMTSGVSYRGLNGAYLFELACSNGQTCKVYVKADKIGEEINFATSAFDYIFLYDNIQIYGKGAGMLEGVEGTIKVVKNDDDTYVIDVDVTNKYLNWGSVSGTPERVRINFTGTPN